MQQCNPKKKSGCYGCYGYSPKKIWMLWIAELPVVSHPTNTLPVETKRCDQVREHGWTSPGAPGDIWRSPYDDPMLH